MDASNIVDDYVDSADLEVGYIGNDKYLVLELP